MQEAPKDTSTEALNRALQRLMSNGGAVSRLSVIDTYTWISSLGLLLLVITFFIGVFFTHLTVYIYGKGIVEVKDNRTVIYGVVPFDQAQNIHTGQKVLIDFPYISTQEFGHLKGIITDFSWFSMNENQKTEAIPNKILRDAVMEGIKVPVMFEISLEEDPSTPSGFKWTSKAGPPYKLASGAIGSIKVAIYEVSPFYYIFPTSTPSQIEAPPSE